MKKWIKQISEWEIYEIRILLKEWYSIPKVAERIWRNKTTIYRLLRNNWVKYNEIKYRYIWWKWWIKFNKDEYLRIEWKRKIQFIPRNIFLEREKRKSIASKRYCRIKPWSKVEWFILEKIKEYYSPKQISWRWRFENKSPLSKDSIYSYIYNNHPELISKYFRRKWKRYQNRRKEKYQIDNRRMIDKRPKIIEKRSTLGHWESDTVVWKKKALNKKVIITNVERKSWYLIANIVENSTAKCVSESIINDFNNLPKYKRRTMTFDNWREFAYHYDIERETKMTTYFAHPYSPWQRWTNENTNWLLRQFLPKWTDFSYLTKEELQKYVILLNNRPRERLWFLTPNEVFYNFKKSCIWL
jgi:IS30 family transposase